MRKAIVYCHDIEAGLLEESTPGRGYTFTYDKQYMMDRTRILSHLPCTNIKKIE